MMENNLSNHKLKTGDLCHLVNILKEEYEGKEVVLLKHFEEKEQWKAYLKDFDKTIRVSESNLQLPSQKCRRTRSLNEILEESESDEGKKSFMATKRTLSENDVDPSNLFSIYSWEAAIPYPPRPDNIANSSCSESGGAFIDEIDTAPTDTSFAKVQTVLSLDDVGGEKIEIDTPLGENEVWIGLSPCAGF